MDVSTTLKGYRLASFSGNWVTTTSADVTGLSVDIKTTGRPIIIKVLSTRFSSEETSNSTGGVIRIYRNATEVAAFNMSLDAEQSTSSGDLAFNLPFSLEWIDTPSAGTYTYKVNMSPFGSSQVGISSGQLLVYEI